MVDRIQEYMVRRINNHIYDNKFDYKLEKNDYVGQKETDKVLEKPKYISENDTFS